MEEAVYLIQRARFKDSDNPVNVDDLLRFDYMGSAEFEWDALPNSLKRVKENAEQYVLFTQETSLGDVTVLCKKEQVDEIPEVLEKLINKEYRLKEYCDLAKSLTGGEEHSNDFWWDIRNDFFFWNPEASGFSNEEVKEFILS